MNCDVTFLVDLVVRSLALQRLVERGADDVPGGVVDDDEVDDCLRVLAATCVLSQSGLDQAQLGSVERHVTVDHRHLRIGGVLLLRRRDSALDGDADVELRYMRSCVDVSAGPRGVLVWPDGGRP